MKNNIKIERTRCDLTQAKLAELIQVSRQTINALERGNYVPSTVLALKLAKILNSQVEDLFILEEND